MWNRGPSLFWGGFLVIIGVLLLLANTGVLANVDWNYVWPVLLIALGLWLILARIGPGGATGAVDTSDSRDGLTRARLDVAVGSGRIQARSAALGEQLYKAHIEHAGTAPEVKLDRSTGTLRISQRLDWFAGARRLRIDAQLADAIPWEIGLSTGAIRGEFNLASTSLTAFDCRTGASQVDLTVGTPKGSVPIRVEGGALTVNIVRPTGTPIRIQASGGAVQLRADGSRQDGIGSRDWRSPEYDSAADRYDVTVSGGALSVSIASR
jgi:hypothetical protein